MYTSLLNSCVLSIHHRPGARVGVQTSDEIVDVLCRLVEVDLAEVRFVEEGIIGGPNLGLFDTNSSVLGNHLDSLAHGLDSLGVHEVVVEAVNGVVDGDVALPGQQEVTSIKTSIRIEDGESSSCISFYQCPGDGAGSSVSWQQ